MIHPRQNYPIKIHPSQNQTNQNQPEPKPTRSKSTCLIQPNSTQGQNWTSYSSMRVDFLTGCVFSELRHFRIQCHIYIASLQNCGSLLHRLSLFIDVTFARATLLHSKAFTQRRQFCIATLLHSVTLARRWYFCTAIILHLVNFT